MNPKDVVYEDGKAAQLGVIAERLQEIQATLYFVALLLFIIFVGIVLK